MIACLAAPAAFSQGKPQTLTFYGGEPFVIFSYKTGVPSFSANIRSRKVSYLAGLARSERDDEGFTYDCGAHFITNRLAAALGVSSTCRASPPRAASSS